MWTNNMMEGYGVLKNDRGGIYEGSFVSGLKHGTGIETFPTGDVYIGNYRNGL
jgi:hypothetical protein